MAGKPKRRARLAALAGENGTAPSSDPQPPTIPSAAQPTTWWRPAELHPPKVDGENTPGLRWLLVEDETGRTVDSRTLHARVGRRIDPRTARSLGLRWEAQCVSCDG